MCRLARSLIGLSQSACYDQLPLVGVEVALTQARGCIRMLADRLQIESSGRRP